LGGPADLEEFLSEALEDRKKRAVANHIVEFHEVLRGNAAAAIQLADVALWHQLLQQEMLQMLLPLSEDFCRLAETHTKLNFKGPPICFVLEAYQH
jgi:hypothetical protein